MKHYVIKIADIPPWRTALRAEADAGSPYAYIDEFTDEAKIALPVTGLIAQIGNATASICQLDDDQYQWLIGLPQVIELGSGDPYIKEMADITWIGSGLGLYHAIHDQTPVDHGNGPVAPPLLHCVLTS